jgi:hypothetical protein
MSWTQAVRWGVGMRKALAMAVLAMLCGCSAPQNQTVEQATPGDAQCVQSGSQSQTNTFACRMAHGNRSGH